MIVFRLAGAAMALVAVTAAAQAPVDIQTKIEVRKLGPAVRVSPVTFGSVQHIRRLSDGRVLVNDASRHQVVLLDSMLANPVVVIDSVGGRDNSYGGRAGGIIPYRADSTLFVDPTSSTMLLIDPAGKIARVMSIPTGAVSYLSNPNAYGMPAFTENFGVVFRMTSSTFRYDRPMPREGEPAIVYNYEDSVAIVGMKLSTRRGDTIVKFGTGQPEVMKVSYNNFNSNSPDELYPSINDWAVTTDGSIALLNAREYRLRWINADGTKTESPRIPFSWQHNTDDDKMRIADSINAVREANYQERLAQQKRAEDAFKAGVPLRPGDPKLTSAPRPPTRQDKILMTDIPDYFPAYEKSSTSIRADGDNRLWIRPRPSKPVVGGPIYDIVDRKGELVDRVQLPAGRTLAGFGPGGIVYMTTRDAGSVKLEQLSVSVGGQPPAF